MKLTVNLDEEVLDNVVKITGSTTKTEAIMKALREIERKPRLVEVLREGLGASESELKTSPISIQIHLSINHASPAAYRTCDNQFRRITCLLGWFLSAVRVTFPLTAKPIPFHNDAPGKLELQKTIQDK